MVRFDVLDDLLVFVQLNFTNLDVHNLYDVHTYSGINGW